MASTMIEEVASTVGKVAVSASTNETTTAVEDMQNWDEIVYEVMLGTVTDTSVINITAKENTASSVTTPTPTAVTLSLGGVTQPSGVTAAISSGVLVLTCTTGANASNKLVRIAVSHQAMTKRYQFLSVNPDTANAAIVSITTLKRRSRSVAISDSSDVIATAYAAA